jgi:hypothetical protein
VTLIEETVVVVVDEHQADDDLGHILCCETEIGPTIALCGTSTTWTGVDGDETDCVVCADLDAADYCPLRPNHHCPYGDDGFGFDDLAPWQRALIDRLFRR